MTKVSHVAANGKCLSLVIQLTLWFFLQLLQVCKSWEDYLWAFYRVMVDVRVEQVGIENFQTKRVWIIVKKKEIEPMAVGVASLYLNHNLSCQNNDSVLTTFAATSTTNN